MFDGELQPLPVDGLEMLALLVAGEGFPARGASVHTLDCPAGPNSTVVYFSREDRAVEVGRVPAAGGHVPRDRSRSGGGFFAPFDTGNT